jgi:hypothetical protein
VAVVLGLVAGECAALALFSGSIDRFMEQQAARSAASAPAVVQQSTNLQSMRDARAALDHAVDAARAQRDESLVVARCEYHPTTPCPQTRITGVPGSGPESRTANELLADSQHELDQAVAARATQAPALDARIDGGAQLLEQARQQASANLDHGLGARWVALQQLTSGSGGILALRLLTDGFFIFLFVLPLMLRRWRRDTRHGRQEQARAEREHAELTADTAIAVKRAEVRAAVENLWAEQQLEQARLAVEAQAAIDRAQLSQRVSAAIEVAPAPVDEDMYLPIAAEAHAASVAAAEPTNLPAALEASDVPADQPVPSIPDIARAAARWARPLVPDIITRAIDTSTHPFRTARHVIEEVEHITFSLTRTRRVTVEAAEIAPPGSPSREPLIAVAPATSPDGYALGIGRGGPHRELTTQESAGELREASGPRQLPPAD